LVLVWLWSAGNALGVTDGDEQAREAAAAWMSGAGANTAVVELAHYVSAAEALVSGYRKADAPGWAARRLPGGRVTWALRRTVDEQATA
jgi:hypothetical protein